MKLTFPLVAVLFAGALVISLTAFAQQTENAAAATTANANQIFGKRLALNDKQDFEDTNRGLLAKPNDPVVKPADSRTLSLWPSNTPVTAVPLDYAPPSAHRWFRIESGLDKGKLLYYFDYVIGKGTPNATVLFVHGNPESSYAYRYVRASLERNTKQALRIIGMDHIGFGLSDQASFEMVDMHHAENLRQLVAYLDPKNVTLVVHDWGGPIGIGALLHSPERVSNLVILNSTVFPLPADGLTYENFPYTWFPWSKFPDRIPAKLWGSVAAFAIETPKVQGFGPIMDMAGELVKAAMNLTSANESPSALLWRTQFATLANANSSRRNVRQTPVWGYGYEYDDPTIGRQDNKPFYAFIQGNISKAWYEQRQIKVSGLFGAWDPLAKASVLAQWQIALPQIAGHIATFDDASHFIEEVKGPEIAAEILKLTGSE